MSKVICCGDLDGDGDIEVVTFWNGGKIHVHDHLGQPVVGFPIELPVSGAFRFDDRVALGDVTGDGTLEIVVAPRIGGLDRVCVINHTGSILPGWPVALGDGIAVTGLSVGDVQFDGDDEVVVGTFSGDLAAGVPLTSPIFLLEGDGSALPGWPTTASPTPFHTTQLWYPTLVDLDGDLICEIVGTGLHQVHILRADGSLFEPSATLAEVSSPPAVGDVDGDGHLEIVAAGLDIGVKHLGSFSMQFLDNGWYNYKGSPVLGDVDGDGAQEITVWSGSWPGITGHTLHVVHGDLTPVPGWPRHIPEMISSPAGMRPAIVDLDGDSVLEVVYEYYPNGSISEHGLRAERIECGAAGAIEWGVRGRDATHSGFYHRGNYPQAYFLRGDVDGSGEVHFSDALRTIGTVFFGESVDCLESADFNADGAVDVCDVISSLSYLFIGGPAPDVGPWPECSGIDPPIQISCSEGGCP